MTASSGFHSVGSPSGRRAVVDAAILEQAIVDDFANETATYLLQACREFNVIPRRIGIDAPHRPKAPGLSQRRSEAAPSAARISCFASPSEEQFEEIVEKARRHLAVGGAESRIPHANQLWMIVGFALFRRLEDLAPCIEVYPHATARAIGAASISKLRPGGVAAQLSTASRFTRWPSGAEAEPALEDIAFGPAHDRLDAYLSAWGAALEEDRRSAYGVPPYDAIWVPRLTGSDKGACTPPLEILFEVLMEPDGGFVASAGTEGIVSRADTWEELRVSVLEAVSALYGTEGGPSRIRLRLSREEILARGARSGWCPTST